MPKRSLHWWSLAWLIVVGIMSIVHISNTGAGSPVKLPQQGDSGATLYSGTSQSWQEFGCGKMVTPRVINVTCPPYRAIPDDDQDDSAAFQAAINALPHGGGILLIPEGRYLFAKPLIIQKSVHLLGAGESTVLAHTGNLSTAGASNFVRIGGASGETRDVFISHLTLEGRQAPGLRTSIIRIVDRVRGVTIRDVVFRNVSSTCILILGNNIQDIHIYGNRAFEFYEQFVELASGGVRSVYIAHNHAHATSGHPDLKSTKPFGIVFEPRRTGEIRDVFMFDNEILFEGMSKRESINTGGISLSVGAQAASFVYRNIHIMNNTIRRAGVGIRVQTLRADDATAPGSIVIQGNHLEDIEADAIQVRPSKDSSQHDVVTIVNNIIRGYSAHKKGAFDGIRLSGNALFPQIQGNHILPASKDKPGQGRYGISIGSGVRHAIAIDNTVADYGVDGVSDEGTSSYIQNNPVSSASGQLLRR